MNTHEIEIPVYWTRERREILGKAFSPAGARAILLKDLSTWHGYAHRAPTLNHVKFDHEHNCYYGVWGGVTEADRAEIRKREESFGIRDHRSQHTHGWMVAPNVHCRRCPHAEILPAWGLGRCPGCTRSAG